MPQLDYRQLDQPEITNILFHPRQEGGNKSASKIITHKITVEDEVSINCRFHLAAPTDPHLLFFHGNGETAHDYDEIGPHYVAHGLNLMVTDYRGYGESDGTPSASSMIGDSRIIFDSIKRWLEKEERTGPLFIMGRSLGSASAIELARSYQEEIDGLILDSAFAQTMPLLSDLGLDMQSLNITEVDGFNNVQKIGKITKPVFILHASKDQLIPLVNAEILHQQCASRSKELQVVPGADHNNILIVAGDLYFSALKQFTNKTLKVRTKRRV